MVGDCGEVQRASHANTVAGGMPDFSAFNKGVGVVWSRLDAANIGVRGVAGVDVQVTPVEIAVRIKRRFF